MDTNEKAIAKFAVPIEKVLDKPAQEIGEGLGNLFWLIFYPLLKARINMEHKIEKYKEEIQKEINKIPAGEIVEPKISIVGPALEASKYYIDDQEIRSMFAKLIASSMKADLHHMAHPAFIEVIKQLTPIDAVIFKYMVDSPTFPIGRVVVEYDNFTSKTWIPTLFSVPEELLLPFFPDENITINYSFIASSVDNLVRLGLLNINYDKSHADESFYAPLYEHPIFKQCQEDKELLSEPNNPKVVLKKAVWRLTDFGYQFKECCL